MKKSKSVLVDVRSEKEWQQGHIKGANLVPVMSPRKEGEPKMLAKTLPK